MNASPKQYAVIASATFVRRYKKLVRRDAHMRDLFATALAQLEREPTAHRSIKKLVGVSAGSGAWRLRLGVYRMRYDIVGTNVFLHTIGPRKDIYRKK